MNVLFLSVCTFNSYNESGIYPDLLRSIIKKENKVFSILPSVSSGEDKIIREGNNTLLQINTEQVTGNKNFIQKGIRLFFLAGKYKKAIIKYCSNEHFDLILYSTPPITIFKAIKYAKKKFKAKTYLLLKDIFPQNALDINILSRRGIKGIVTAWSKRTERKYYNISDKIGCMSEANCKYLFAKNPFIDKAKVEINPNSLEIKELPEIRYSSELRANLNISNNSTIFLYGGNLGKPQDVPFIVECLMENANREDRWFIISGKGSEYQVLEKYIKDAHPKNVYLINGLPHNEYDLLVAACDVGLIFLDHRFTIPNYPSRLLSYLQNGLPVIACTDSNTDIGKDIVSGDFGWSCESTAVANFTNVINEICSLDKSEIRERGLNGYAYLQKHFAVEDSREKIINFVNGGKP